MNKLLKVMAFAAILFSAAFSLQSCDDDDDNTTICIDPVYTPNALVTFKTNPENGQVYMQLNDSVTLVDKDYKQWPFNATDKKELRALVSVIFDDDNDKGLQRNVHIVNVFDTIRTKPMSPIVNDMEKVYGDDPIEIVDSWKTVCEDGYLTLHFRTLFGGMKIHTLRLVRLADGTLRLYHDANGDAKGAVSDGIIAFRLNDVPKPADGGKYENITLKWTSFSGEKSHTFKYKYRE